MFKYVSLFWLYGCLLFVACQAQSPTTTPAVSEIPPTSTILPTTTAIPTLTPSVVAVPTNTPTPPPSPSLTLADITPTATLISLDPTQYYLKANFPIPANLLEQFPVDYGISSSPDDNYFFRGLVLGEALLKFKDNIEPEQKQLWMWQQAYHFAHIPDTVPLARELFKELILDGLNRGFTPEELEVWANEQFKLALSQPNLTPRFALYVLPAPTPAGYEAGYLLQLFTSKDLPQSIYNRTTGTYYFLAQTKNNYELYPLSYDTDLDLFEGFYQPIEMYDFTEDGINELVLVQYHSQSPMAFDNMAFEYHIIKPVMQIFDVSHMPPQSLPLPSRLKYPGLMSTEQPDPTQPPQYVSTIYYGRLGECVEGETRYIFQWQNNEGFMLTQTEIPSTILTSCPYVGDIYNLLNQAWQSPELLALLEEFIAVIPKNQDFYYADPEEEADKVRFYLGLLYAKHSLSDKARQQFQALIDAPSSPDSSYIAKSAAFLAHYDTTQSWVKACQAILTECANLTFRFFRLKEIDPLCFPSECYEGIYIYPALEEWVQQEQSLQFYFEQAGLNILMEGEADFLQNGTKNQWYLSRQEEDEEGVYKMWIIAPGQKLMVHVVYFGHLDKEMTASDISLTIAPFAQDFMPNLFRLKMGDFVKFFYFNQLSSELIIPVEYSSQRLALDLYAQLLMGADPQYIKQQMEQNIHLSNEQNAKLCYREDYISLYLLGLTSELLQQPDEAVKYYVRLYNCEHRYGDEPAINLWKLFAEQKIEIKP